MNDCDFCGKLACDCECADEQSKLWARMVELQTIPEEMEILKAQCREVQAENEKLKRLLKRCQAPLRLASAKYMYDDMWGQEHKTDCLIDAIKAALKGRS